MACPEIELHFIMALLTEVLKTNRVTPKNLENLENCGQFLFITSNMLFSMVVLVMDKHR